MRALYATGFFRDVQLRRDGNTLIVVVLERPSIESFEIKGNKDIKTEDLQKSLRNVGLAAGKTFDRSALEEVTQYLTDQYYSRGKYAVKIDAKVENLPDNRVKSSIDIKEGRRAKIRQINIVGNTRFKEKDILETLALKTPNWLSWYKQDDRYSRESLQGDLEKIRTYYMDRGYANFQIDSVQVAIAPGEGRHLHHRQRHRGRGLQARRDQARRQPGRARGGAAAAAAGRTRADLFAEDHHRDAGADEEPARRARASISPRSSRCRQMDNANKIVALTFFVDPGNRVYVRNINFTGTTRINDERLRREMRQLEGALAVERRARALQAAPAAPAVRQERRR